MRDGRDRDRYSGYAGGGPGYGPDLGEDVPAGALPLWRRGPHTGKGPKGYKRSDERIREDVCDVLERHPDIDATDVEVIVKDGLVTLSGTVDERRTKRLAEDVVDGVAGVKDVANHLRIAHGRLDQALSDLSATGTSAAHRFGPASRPGREEGGRRRR